MKILFFILFIIGYQYSAAQQYSYENAIDSVLVFFQENNAFSGRVTLQKGNEILYDGDFNLFGNEKGNYKIGSVTKIFTAVMVFQLIEEGKISLNSQLSEFFPEIRNSNEITIENLLSHTSGIYDFIDGSDYYSTRDQEFSKSQIISLISNGKPSFKPNKDCSYSNSNYVLLGFILEEITGESYSDLVHEKIVNKIGLRNTYCESNGKKSPPLDSYIFNGENWNKDKSSNPSLPFAAGAIVSNNEDIILFLRNLFSGNLVSNSSLEKMKSLKSKTIGHGLFKAMFYQKEGWGHTGRIDEFKSAAFYFPEDSLSLAITMDAGRIPINDIALPVISKYYGRQYTYPKFYSTSISEPDTYIFEGDYKIKLIGFVNVGTMRIKRAENNYLWMTEVNDNKETEWALLERIDAHTFYSRRANTTFTFSIDEKGKIKNLVLQQGNFKIKGFKLN